MNRIRQVTINMSKQAEALVIGGIIGAILAAPKQTDVLELQNYRAQKAEIEKRKTSLGEPHVTPKFKDDTKVYSNFTDAYNLFLAGYFRASAFFSILTVELALKNKYGEYDFNNLIEKAKNDGILDQMNYHFITGMRIKRKVLAHDFSEVAFDDADIIIKLTIRMLNHIYA